jgi:Fur family peroxide stress response transcriptional regulator
MESKSISYEDDRLARIIQMLKNKGFKITAQRIAIINALLKLDKTHPTLTDIHREATKVAPTISFSTVYITVKTLEELGLVKLFSHKGDTVVETDIKPHINVILEDNKIIDIEDPEIIECIKDKLAWHGIDADKFIVNIIAWK